MSRRIARSWRNLAALPVVLFVRMPLLCLLLVFIKIGEGAQRLADFVSICTPGLEDDAEYAYREQKKRIAKTVEGYKGKRK